MSFSQRAPISADAICYPHPSTPLFEATTLLLDNAFSWRPYAAAVIRHAVPTRELDHLNALDGQAQLDALGEASFLPAVNQAMKASWQNKPWVPDVQPTDLTLRRIVTDEDAAPHIDQRITEDDPLPKGGPLVSLLILKSEVEYSFKAKRKNPFSPAHAEFFKQTEKPRPPQAYHLEPPARAGDVVLFLSHTIHYSNDLTGDPDNNLPPRVTAGYLSGFERK